MLDIKKQKNGRLPINSEVHPDSEKGIHSRMSASITISLKF